MLVQDVKEQYVIKATDLCKSYRYYEKEEGVRGSIKNLFFRKYLYKEAVKKLNIDIKQGEIVGLIGLNGAGKSTTLKMLSGLVKPTSGNVEVLCFDPFSKKKEFLSQISMVMGNKSQLWWDLPAIESFNLNCKIYNIPYEKFQKNLEEMSKLLNVTELLHTQVRRLSLGERMKMEIIAALLHEPRIVFLDEPTIGLDVISQYKIREFLKEYNVRHNSTMIITSHNFDDIISLCDNLLILNSGEIIFDDTFANFSKRFSNEKIVTIKVKHNSKLLAVLKDKYKDRAKLVDESTIQFHINDSEISSLLLFLNENNINNVEDIQIENISMDEIVRNIYEK
ncbi:ATP-binding cassette domain-containing protein [Clostridium bornimense]|uniref:ABC transporter ATP-binding protein n=1 Tax=Clostridium bornimense TaxID=1216932 RepID=UPI001C107BDE|nr:ATP-binding cassette domain-containing protein [Clostridium bornimense]MBU5317328.1 ATP-binding cassette domain-containing protein [Clostridium bornimense]